jgi:hypothetical protein
VQATLFPKQNNDFLAHPQAENSPNYSNVFNRTVYGEESNNYADSTGYGDDRNPAIVKQRSPRPRTGLWRLPFMFLRVIEVVLGRNLFKFPYELPKHSHGSKVK